MSITGARRGTTVERVLYDTEIVVSITSLKLDQVAPTINFFVQTGMSHFTTIHPHFMTSTIKLQPLRSTDRSQTSVMLRH